MMGMYPAVALAGYLMCLGVETAMWVNRGCKQPSAREFYGWAKCTLSLGTAIDLGDPWPLLRPDTSRQTRQKQILLAVLLLLIMGGGVAWIAFGLVKTIPILFRVYGAAAAMKRRSDLLKRADSRPLSEEDIDTIREMTVELKAQVKGDLAERLVERELELTAVAKSAVANGEWEKARALLAGLRRTWP